MAKPTVYIDGQAGTTGLQIYDRLASRQDITLLTIDPDRRKDPAERKKLLNSADLVFLCLPDDAAREAVSLVDDPDTRIIDASTAHRTHPGWTYGFPELSPGRREAIRAGRRVANPGCHATGFLAAAYPLVTGGLVPADVPLTCFSLTGYSGGGKGMIAQYEGEKTPDLWSPRVYGLSLRHKHLPEMKAICGLTADPVFLPVVDDYYKGMATTLMLPKLPPDAVYEALAAFYRGERLIRVVPPEDAPAMLAANTLAGRDCLTLTVYGSGENTAVTALFDNLGKGASGAAVQNMNLMLGFEETAGLSL